MKKIIPLLIALLMLTLSVEVFAKPLISVGMKAEKEITVNKEKKMVVASKVNPGEVIFFTINYVNSGDEAAINAVLDDAIPKGTVYLNGSAFGKDADITFSIDGGKTFKKPSVLNYEVKLPNGKMEKRIASSDQYTNIRWTVSVVPTRGSGQVGFKVRVK
ncbi:MAG: hypothetical protein CVU62_06645 [Deltaproteobacteria bacterium HGW-Deltaproteobacteria-2]|jgi:uncharacterized repeat protein (TIGR01451 family)|nr:MAG: hypothetical protein CVU62_06645 [Deltaproteobacteria bacterium HGW-Deltaproteobacteria-2]